MEHKKIISKIFITVFLLSTGTKILPAEYFLETACSINGVISTAVKAIETAVVGLDLGMSIKIIKNETISTIIYRSLTEKVNISEINHQIAVDHSISEMQNLAMSIEEIEKFPEKLKCQAIFKTVKENGEIIEKEITREKAFKVKDYKPKSKKPQPSNRKNNHKRRNHKNNKQRFTSGR